MDIYRIKNADNPVNSSSFSPATVKQLEAMGYVVHDHTDLYSAGPKQVYVHFYRKAD